MVPIQKNKSQNKWEDLGANELHKEMTRKEGMNRTLKQELDAVKESRNKQKERADKADDHVNSLKE